MIRIKEHGSKRLVTSMLPLMENSLRLLSPLKKTLDSRVAGDDQVQVGGRGEVTLGGKTVTTVTACIADCAQYRVAGVDRRGVLRGDHVIVSHPDSSPASL